ncbi:MAG: TylF/MycF/NovP-related O-methyltransferase [Endomicrobiia bacterium]
MIPQATYIDNLELIRKFKHIRGDVIECGVWRGGMIAGIAEIYGNDRTYHLFDSFEGLPTAKEIDGEAALNWQSNTQSLGYYDNCKAEMEFAQTAMQKSNVSQVHYHKGWFNQTLSNFKSENGIAILRMDADWYDSTMDILANLFPQVNKGGIIVLDDYYTWDGCSRALHDYLSKHKLTEKLRQYKEHICFIIKN